MAVKKSTTKKKTEASQSKKNGSTAKKTDTAKKPAKENKRTIAKKKSFIKSEVKVIAALVLGGFMLLTDLGLMGTAGAFLLTFQRGLFGQGYVLFGISIVAAAFVAVRYKDTYFLKLKVVCVFGLLITGTALIHIMFSPDRDAAVNVALTELYREASTGASGGGLIGGSIANLLKSLIGYAGAYLVLVASIVALLVIITEKSFVNAAKVGASKTAEAVINGAGKTVEAAKLGQEKYREIHRENVIRRDARREERRLRKLEADFPGYESDGGLELDAGGSSLPADIDISGMRKEAEQAEVYASYGRDIIGDGQPGVDTLGTVKQPLFAAGYTNKRSNEGMNFDTAVIEGDFDLNVDTTKPEEVKVREIDYDSDEIPFEETEEDRYKSYAHILESGEVSLEVARRAGYAVNAEAKSAGDNGLGTGVTGYEPHHMEAFETGVSSGTYDGIDIRNREYERAASNSDLENNAEKNEYSAANGGFGTEGKNGRNDERDYAGMDFDTDAEAAADQGYISVTETGTQRKADADYYTTVSGKEMKSPDSYEADSILRDKGITPASELNAQVTHGNIGTYTSNVPTLNPSDKLGGSVLDTGLAAAKGTAGAASSAAMAASGTAAVSSAVGRGSTEHTAAQKTTNRGGAAGTAAASAAQQPKPKPRPYVYPRVNLLEKGVRADRGGYERLRANAAKLQKVLRDFGVGVTVTNITVGPRVSRYELTPDAGVKVSRITSLTGDIKLALAAREIRIEAPIPGKSAVGVEVPNETSSTVKFRDILESEEFKNAKSRLCWGVGLDIGGNTIISDISKMPHILVAGTTGSGKSVGINSLIMSILYRATPQEVRMILVDPKQVEFTVYNGIPHLLTDVVTSPERALSALNWAVAEMNRRYKLFQESGTRNIKGYNEKIEKVADTLPEESAPEKLPFILIIIDELSELMMHAKKDVESCIVSLAQLARAAGIHLVVATQRPSVDVVTGLIKSNIPSRVAFKLPSVTDSRTILDSGGAESLLGNGDMLYKPGDKSNPIRVQGAFLSDDEVENVVSFIKKHNPQESGHEVDTAIAQQMELNFSGQPQDKANDDATDEYFADAGRLIIMSGKASIGGLQRKFKIGFNRAARIMDQLCEAGVVGDGEGTKERRILMSVEEFEELLGKK